MHAIISFGSSKIEKILFSVHIYLFYFLFTFLSLITEALCYQLIQMFHMQLTYTRCSVLIYLRISYETTSHATSSTMHATYKLHYGFYLKLVIMLPKFSICYH
ncbi:hypothetical protein ACQJBY_059313 [Aegilops geniculata]